MMKSLSGKRAIVTGAANGVGRALSQQLAHIGCNLILIDMDEAQLYKTLESIRSTSVKVVTRVMDISKPGDWDSLLNTLQETISNVDILINNAAVSVEASLSVTKVEDIDWVIDINLKGAIYGTRYLLPLLLKAPEANIMNVSSTAGLSGFPNKTLYCASKFGLKGFTESLSAELYHTKVHVGCAHPGPINTTMLDRSHIYDSSKITQMKAYLSQKGQSPEQVAREIIDGILKNKIEVLISSETKSVWWMKRMIPNFFVKMIGKYQDKLPA